MKIYNQQFDIKKFSEKGNLLSHEQGQRIREGIKKELKKLAYGEILFLDFRNIRYVTPACLIEILLVYNELQKREFQNKYLIILLESNNYDLKESFSLILKEKKDVVLCLDEKGKWEVLGEFTKAQTDTLFVVFERQEITSTELSGYFNIAINAASNRLKNLYNLKLVMRKEERLASKGGRQFVYRCVFH